MGKSYYITKSGILKREKGTVVLRTDGGPIYLPIGDIDDIYVFSEITLNKRLMAFLREHGVLIHFYDRAGYIGSFMPESAGVSSYVFIKQVEYYADNAKRLILAKALVKGMIEGIEKAVDKWYRTGKVKSSVDVDKYITMLNDSDSVNAVRQVEGAVRKEYYRFLNAVLPEFVSRSRRPPKNSVNALMSFAYALLYGAVLTAIFQSPLDTKVSYVHEPRFHSHPLRLDLADLFKVPIVDRFILSLYRDGKVKPSWFVSYGEGVFLSMHGKREFLKYWHALMKKKAKTTRYGKSVSTRRLFYKECMKLTRYFIDKTSYYAYSG